jgi:hypothetical protein
MNIQLQENNYIIIPNFIDVSKALDLASQFREFASSKNIKGDHQVPDSSSSYNYMPFLKLVVEKLPHVEEISGEELSPVCCYSRVYRKGNVLKRHKDRPGCEISVTLNLDGDADWPIYVKNPDGKEVAIDLKPGDAAMYLGHAAEHWREEFSGNEYIQVFLHYVNSKGQFKDEGAEFKNFILRNPLK